MGEEDAGVPEIDKGEHSGVAEDSSSEEHVHAKLEENQVVSVGGTLLSPVTVMFKLIHAHCTLRTVAHSREFESFALVAVV